MEIIPCPICNNTPKIKELPFGKEGKRRRYCFCPRLDPIIPDLLNGLNYPGFIVYGEGGTNAIYKIWDRAIVPKY